MKHLLMLLALVLSLCSCSSFQVGCIAQNQGSQLVSSVIVAQLHCSNSAQVEADVLVMAKKLSLCSADVKGGPVASLVCPAVSKIAANFFSSKVVPASWGCQTSNIQVGLQAAIQAACQQLPLAPAK